MEVPGSMNILMSNGFISGEQARLSENKKIHCLLQCLIFVSKKIIYVGDKSVLFILNICIVERE